MKRCAITKDFLCEALCHGFRNGELRTNEHPIPAVLHDVLSLIECIHARKAEGYETETFLLFVPQLMGCAGLVVKVVSLVDEALLAVTARECVVLQQLHMQACPFVVPRYMGSVEYLGVRLFVTEYLPRHMASEMMLGEFEVRKIASSIRDMQDCLRVTKVGAHLLAGTTNFGSYYESKLRTYLSKRFALDLPPESLGFLDSLEYLRCTHATVVSDRSPTNIILCDDEIGMFDFGLLLVGTLLEDWSWFIDDPRLKTHLTRDDVLKIFCEVNSHTLGMSMVEMKNAFSVASFFVCIKQYCLMLDADRNEMANHYWCRALVSARSIADYRAVQVLKNIETRP